MSTYYVVLPFTEAYLLRYIVDPVNNAMIRVERRTNEHGKLHFHHEWPSCDDCRQKRYFIFSTVFTFPNLFLD